MPKNEKFIKGLIRGFKECGGSGGECNCRMGAGVILVSAKGVGRK